MQGGCYGAVCIQYHREGNPNVAINLVIIVSAVTNMQPAGLIQAHGSSQAILNHSFKSLIHLSNQVAAKYTSKQ